MSDKYTPKWCAEECVEASREIAALRTALAASEAEVAKVNHEGVRCREDLRILCERREAAVEAREKAEREREEEREQRRQIDAYAELGITYEEAWRRIGAGCLDLRDLSTPPPTRAAETGEVERAAAIIKASGLYHGTKGKAKDLARMILSSLPSRASRAAIRHEAFEEAVGTAWREFTHRKKQGVETDAAQIECAIRALDEVKP